MTAHIEWLIGVVRQGKRFKTYGDPYDFSATIRVVGNKAELVAAAGSMDKATYTEIKEALAEQGLQLWWRRKKDGREYTIGE